MEANGEVPALMDHNSKLYDEVVISQESQIAPAYVIRYFVVCLIITLSRLEQKECSSQMRSWVREAEERGRAFREDRRPNASRASTSATTLSVSQPGSDATSMSMGGGDDMYVPLLDLSQG